MAFMSVRIRSSCPSDRNTLRMIDEVQSRQLNHGHQRLVGQSVGRSVRPYRYDSSRSAAAVELILIQLSQIFLFNPTDELTQYCMHATGMSRTMAISFVSGANTTDSFILQRPHGYILWMYSQRRVLRGSSGYRKSLRMLFAL
jgi:hypothetical protein